MMEPHGVSHPQSPSNSQNRISSKPGYGSTFAGKFMRTVLSFFLGTVAFAAVFAFVNRAPQTPNPVQVARLEISEDAELPPQRFDPQLQPSPQLAPVPVPPVKPIGKADLIKLDKSDRQLQLLRDGEVIAAYAVALGDAPEGAKQKQGDERTPEGQYLIDWRNPRSHYFLSLHISYPDAKDKARAAKAGVDPGGEIMIHGQPNGFVVAGPALQSFDWTDGCIAVTNDVMQQIWDAVPDGTPIEISP
jgi:lipoprotein-anchoring transpeptidase ErfK/SrfK